jgi:hypothetical protein
MTEPSRLGRPAPRPVGSIVLGVGRIARGRADGVTQFSGTPQAFLSSLAPLLAFALVGCFMLLLHGDGLPAVVTELLRTVVIALAPAVLSEPIARFWGRGEQWLRFATALNWCQWAMPVAVAFGLMFGSLLTLFGASTAQAGRVVVAVVLGYGFWIEWFLTRHALELSRWRSAALVLAINLGTGLLATVPSIIAYAAF